MKTISVILILVGVAAQHSMGQGAPGAAITQRARELRDQNNAAQGVPPKTSSNPTPTSSAAPAAPPQNVKPATPPSPAQIQQQKINKLKNDISGFLMEKSVSQEKIARFTTNLTAAVRGPRKPKAETIAGLAAGIGSQLTGRKMGSPDQLRLAENLDAVVNGSRLSRLQAEAYVFDIQQILQQAGVKNEDAEAVAAVAKTAITELKP